MFKSLRDIWKESKAQVEAEMKAEAEKSAATPAGVPRVADMSLLAAEFMMNCAKQGIELPLTPDSLPKLDKLIAGARRALVEAEAAREPGVATLVANTRAWIAAYLGEMLQKQVAGVWADAGGRPVIRVYGGELLSPLDVATGLLRNGVAKEGDRSFDSASAWCGFVFDRVEGALEGTVCGSHASLDELKASMADDPDLAHRLTGTLHMALTTGHAKWNVALDFSLDSVKHVESILDRLHIMTAKAAPDQKPNEDQIAGVAGVWGVYVGEVMRRACGGTWSMPNGALTLTMGQTTCWPTQKVRKRLADGEADGIPFYVHSSLKLARGELVVPGR